MTTQLSILNNSIRTFENLFSLTDLHKASGGENKHKPTFFLRLDQTKDLIAEIEVNTELQICNSVKVIHGGPNSGTYACEELVLAYATWISPKFHLVVLRAFLNMHKNEQLQKTQQLALLKPQIDPNELKTLLKIYQYANRWKEFQQAIGNCGETSNDVLKQEIATLCSHCGDNDGYLFIFSPNVERDVQQAGELLMRLVKNQ
ncbi:hypothetical protein BKG91_11660 [Rodentibacter caecimuris]|uniref:KilA-N domain-containing protein n=1 Tax=Rodentibacter caecimuris TaxID=1796644 RepID=UPI000750A48F|nr:KilA-N domain-containing protein [Rodentibacter heylii]AOF53680.1 Phage DNA and RNA binding protein [Pasteurellaceae bacterium NI1060]OOF71214.1 hypothetical protein BKG91_11660 [Rodentibacter heylii]